nr:cleavage stimulating factor 64 [Ipomoea batatas]
MSNIVGKSKKELYDIMCEMKKLMEQNEEQARQILIENPTLARDLFHAQIMLGMVQPTQPSPPHKCERLMTDGFAFGKMMMYSPPQAAYTLPQAAYLLKAVSPNFKRRHIARSGVTSSSGVTSQSGVTTPKQRHISSGVTSSRGVHPSSRRWSGGGAGGQDIGHQHPTQMIAALTRRHEQT